MGKESIKSMKSHTPKGFTINGLESRTLKPKLWENLIWTLINNSAIVLACAICLKLITLEENIISVQQCAVLLLKTLSSLPQSIDFSCLILFLMFACNNFPFRAFVTMIYCTSTEVLLNLLAPLDSPVPSLDFEQINVFWTSGYDFVNNVFDSISVSTSLPGLYFSRSI